MTYVYLSGAASGLALTAAVFFLRYWRESKDRFFAIWAASLVLLAAQWGVSAFTGSDAQAYLLRLAGFLMIVAAIVDKNRGGAGRRRRRRSSLRALPVRVAERRAS